MSEIHQIYFRGQHVLRQSCGNTQPWSTKHSPPMTWPRGLEANVSHHKPMQMASNCRMRCKITWFLGSSCHHHWQVHNLQGCPIISTVTVASCHLRFRRKEVMWPWAIFAMEQRWLFACFTTNVTETVPAPQSKSPFQPALHQPTTDPRQNKVMQIWNWHSVKSHCKKDFHLYIFYKIIRLFQAFQWFSMSNCRKLTYPNLGKGKSSSKSALLGDML